MNIWTLDTIEVSSTTRVYGLSVIPFSTDYWIYIRGRRCIILDVDRSAIRRIVRVRLLITEKLLKNLRFNHRCSPLGIQEHK
ncbi:hypothetical protein V1478_016425 [Vespula squamosa]|uniref:Uncharacterized protein n=1 Tax=Vespula squamosa TaxID=30214 RepID=A0ABD1ZZQ8_VESSQ